MKYILALLITMSSGLAFGCDYYSTENQSDIATAKVFYKGYGHKLKLTTYRTEGPAIMAGQREMEAVVTEYHVRPDHYLFQSFTMKPVHGDGNLDAILREVNSVRGDDDSPTILIIGTGYVLYEDCS